VAAARARICADSGPYSAGGNRQERDRHETRNRGDGPVASSDSDFTTLASRIREDGVSVYGFGEQKASTAYVRSCDRFFYCDLLVSEEKGGGEAKTAKHARLPVDDILAAIDDLSGEEGWARLGEVGQILNKRRPDFDPRNYGFKKLSSLVESLKSVEVRNAKGAGGRMIEVRVKPKRQSEPKL
jgi:hypothetical protein